MKKLSIFLLIASLTLPLMSDAQRNTRPSPTKSRAVKAKARAKAKPRVQSANTRQATLRNQLNNAIRAARAGRHEAAANALFSLSRRSELKAERSQIKYILGTMLMEMKLYQTAAFQFVDVIRMNNPKYSKAAIEKLSIVADTLGDDTILNYAINRVNVADFPENLKDMIYYRMGEIKLKGRDFRQATDLLGRVSPSSSYYFQAQYNKGLAELEANQPTLAISTYRKMIASRQAAPPTDTNKVAAQLALARALYQKQDWEGSIEAYAQIPRDTLMWHDALFEQSWAMLRAARFRSVLSNFQSLHSAYYEDFYMPESLLLRSIVYLYICKYDEMEKVLSLFEKTYGPVRSSVGDFLRSTNDANAYYLEVEKAAALKRGQGNVGLRLPYIVARNVLDQGDVKHSMNYLARLNEEKARIEANPTFRASSLGQYALKIIANRSKNTKYAIGDMVKAHLLNVRVELRDLYEQAGFIRYEMINGRKENIKKRIAGRDISDSQIDDKIDRQFYIQNGFEYYPFQGEYWLDEIGNYHYLGQQSCE